MKLSYRPSYWQKINYLYSKICKKLRSSSIINSTIHPTSKVESGSNVVAVTMDKYSFCGYDCELINCEVGSFCSIANNVIIGGAMHPIKWGSTSPVFYYGRDSVTKKFSEYEREPDKRTVIGHDVWIGHSALIKQGVIIGTGAVVGMGAVVTKDVPPYAIVAGNPAKVIKMRFEQDIIEQLLDLKWWELSDGQLGDCAEFIKEPIQFIKAIKRIR